MEETSSNTQRNLLVIFQFVQATRPLLLRLGVLQLGWWCWNKANMRKAIRLNGVAIFRLSISISNRWYGSFGRAKALQGKLKIIYVLDDEPHKQSMMVDELKYFQALLVKPKSSLIYCQGQPLPTSSRCTIRPSWTPGGNPARRVIVKSFRQCRTLKRMARAYCRERILEWHDLMRKRHPVKFKGKRPPRT
jgi:hypothetical protein